MKKEKVEINFDQSQNLLFGKELNNSTYNPLTDKTFLDPSKLKAFEVDNFKMIQVINLSIIGEKKHHWN